MANHIPGEHIFKLQSMLGWLLTFTWYINLTLKIDPEHESSYISGQPSGIPEDSALWEDYVQEAEQQDSENVANWNQTMDVLLVFVRFFFSVKF
jgi:hypothetical protein